MARQVIGKLLDGGLGDQLAQWLDPFAATSKAQTVERADNDAIPFSDWCPMLVGRVRVGRCDLPISAQILNERSEEN